MLALTRKTDYALIALAHLARCDGRLASAREMADRYRVPLPVLINILKALTHEGVIESVRGVRGGYRLARDAGEITLRGVVTALEGPVWLVPCAAAGVLDDAAGFCPLAHSCPVMSPVRKVHDRLMEFLEGVTLAEIAEGFAPPAGATWTRPAEELETHASVLG